MSAFWLAKNSAINYVRIENRDSKNGNNEVWVLSRLCTGIVIGNDPTDTNLVPDERLSPSPNPNP